MASRKNFLFLILLPVFFGNSQSRAQQRVIELVIDHKLSDEELLLERHYTIGNQTVTFTKLKYYLSNIRLRAANGTEWRDPEKYHLVDVEEDGSSNIKINLKGVPTGPISELSFSIGVDSIDNHSGDQLGFLNPDYGMFWMWETGYVFFKVEGYRTSSGNDRGAIIYHVGRDKCFRTTHLSIPGQASSIKLIANVAGIFSGLVGEQLRNASANASISVMGGQKANEAADNFIKIFSIQR